MRTFITLDAIAASLSQDNIDTDKILPGEYLKTVSRAGLGRVLFARMRYRNDGSENPDFVLNRDPWRAAGILVAGDNFGCGSSREHAPWALTDFGISAVIAKSFADIFYNNCFKNGILPIVLDPRDHASLSSFAADPDFARFRIDLPGQVIAAGGAAIRFELDPGRKVALMEGRDEIAETLAQADRIAVWRRENADRSLFPRVVVPGFETVP